MIKYEPKERNLDDEYQSDDTDVKWKKETNDEKDTRQEAIRELKVHKLNLKKKKIQVEKKLKKASINLDKVSGQQDDSIKKLDKLIQAEIKKEVYDKEMNEVQD